MSDREDHDSSSSDSENHIAEDKNAKSKAETSDSEVSDSDTSDSEQNNQARDSEEEDLDEEEEESHNNQKNRKKRKKQRYGGFVLDEAEVDDDYEEDEEEWEEGVEDLISHSPVRGSAESKGLDGHRRLNLMFKSQNEDEIEDYFIKKYAETGDAERVCGGSEQDLPDEIAQRTLLPGVKDPNLWRVKCRMGAEKVTVLQIMRKCVAYQNSDKPLQILSVVAAESKGYIYIEAYKQVHVKHAIEGIGSLRIGQYEQPMVPLNEMTDVLKVIKSGPKLKPDQWVRLSRGIFKDDLAQVVDVDETQNTVQLKLLPRLDYTKKRGILRESNVAQKRKLPTRQPAKLFDADAMRALGGEFRRDGDFLVFEGNCYSSEGFLFKSFPTSAIVADGVKPTLSELEKFNPKLDVKGFGSLQLAHSFEPGDTVCVSEGELIHLEGKITRVDGNTVTMLPNHPDLKDPLEFEASELRKSFKMGQHVKVTDGSCEGQTGLIVRVEEHIVLVLSDLTMEEIKVRPQSLQLCKEVTTGLDSTGQYQWGDLVQIDVQTAGVIVKLEKEDFQVLSSYGRVVKVKRVAILKKMDSNRAIALDSGNNHIRMRDIVKVVDGRYEGKQASIKHLFRGNVFLHSRELLENGGFFVCKSRHLRLVGAPNLSSAPVVKFTPQSPCASTPSRSNTPGGPPRGKFDVSRKDRSLIGQTVKVIQGAYKGYTGIIKDNTANIVKVEMHSNCQTMSFDRSRIMVVSATSGAFSSFAEQNATNGYRTPLNGSRTPMYGSQTPLNGSRTPMYGSPTPLNGSRTPIYGSPTQLYGGQTPLYEAGSRTPYYGDQTPRSDGSRTPLHGSAWDPTILNTPVSTYDDDTVRTPSSSYGASTPSHQSYAHDGSRTPQTPNNE